MTTILDPDDTKQPRIVIIGDVMLDRYLWGDVTRISPEAPVPVFHVRTRSEACGGAGNVAANLIGLGCKPVLISIRGCDEAGARLAALFGEGSIEQHMFEDARRPTITKARVMARSQQLVRIDEEESCPPSRELHGVLLATIRRILPTCHGLILSDYGKGLLRIPGLAEEAIRLARERAIPVIVDPKGTDWSLYRGATCVTPNISEFEAVYGSKCEDTAALVRAMHHVARRFDLQWLLVTRGPEGMCLICRSKNHKPVEIASAARQVYDVSGAGDTVIAVLSHSVARGLSFPDAAALANTAAGVVVGKVGTQPIMREELQAAMHVSANGKLGRYSGKISSLTAAAVRVEAWKAAGARVVFTNGCFDILHPGHIHLLNHARDLGDHLVVGLNSDESIRRVKGGNRPVLCQHDRAAILGSLDCVDLVIVFDEDTPNELLAALRPDALAKGADYREDGVVGREIVESHGGTVHLIPLLSGYTTAKMRNKVLGKESR